MLALPGSAGTVSLLHSPLSVPPDSGAVLLALPLPLPLPSLPAGPDAFDVAAGDKTAGSRVAADVLEAAFETARVTPEDAALSTLSVFSDAGTKTVGRSVLGAVMLSCRGAPVWLALAGLGRRAFPTDPRAAWSVRGLSPAGAEAGRAPSVVSSSGSPAAASVLAAAAAGAPMARLRRAFSFASCCAESGFPDADGAAPPPAAGAGPAGDGALDAAPTETDLGVATGPAATGVLAAVFANFGVSVGFNFSAAFDESCTAVGFFDDMLGAPHPWQAMPLTSLILCKQSHSAGSICSEHGTLTRKPCMSTKDIRNLCKKMRLQIASSRDDSAWSCTYCQSPTSGWPMCAMWMRI